MATTTKKATAGKAAAKKSTARKVPAKQTTARQPAAKKTPLRERELGELLGTAGYAVTGIVSEVVERAKRVPDRVEALRFEVEKAASDAPARVKTFGQDAPARLEASLATLRERVTKDLDRSLASIEHAMDTKAAEGRKTIDNVVKDERVARVLDQAANTRSQLKAALTSVTRTATVAGDAARDQAEVAKSQTKAAATSVKKSAEAVADAATDGE